ncbi:hypothetical protein [Rodentibacter haemolyticus]|uniref:Uncharacterized protein n=1 Tax=Rodentibacter haemolyticus TaxID=2778911 RepID=A0ABX6UZ50_9PAST|nr:hypothetical protein [Rodentibacter haemolyticus]QPB43344.1 hypothetical protein IHV77_04440 [Rodentibacter haemolyticus]
MKVHVLVDIYINYFPRGDNKYIYNNVRAVDQKNNEIVADCIEDMLRNKSVFLFDPELIIVNDISPIEKDRSCILDTELQLFEFFTK